MKGIILAGRTFIIKVNEEYTVELGESIDIPLGMKHSLQNPYDSELKIIEIQNGDCYGRV